MDQLFVVNDLDKKRIIKEISKNDGLLECKIIGYREFIRKFYFDYTEETVLYVTEKYQINKEIAEIYLKNLYYVIDTNKELEKIEFLKELYQDLLKQNLLIKNPLWKEQLKNKKVIFYHIARKNYFFKKVKKECQEITDVEVIDYKICDQQKVEILGFLDLESEVIGVCNHICKLIKKGYPLSHIYLSNLTSDYRHLFKTYSKIFHIPFLLKSEESYLSTQIVSDFIKDDKCGIKNAIEKLKEKYHEPEEIEIIKKIVDICNRYTFMNDEKKKRDFILSDLQKSKRKTMFQKGVQEIDFYEQEIGEKSILFVLGVNEGAFPRIIKDEKFLRDIELKELGFETTEEQNILEKNICQTKLKTFSHIFLSFPQKDGKLELYPASILNSLNCNVISVAKEDYQHSHLYNKLSFATKMDHFKKYGSIHPDLSKLKKTYPNISYSNYQNIFHPFKIEEQPLKLFYTSLDTFFHCAFRYYLDHILKLNQSIDSFDKKIGTLFHQILKESYETNFEFEKSWAKNTKDFIFMDAKEAFFLSKLKKDLIRVLSTLEKQEKEKKFQILTEQPLTYSLEDHKEVTLKGILDKVFIKKQKDQTLVSIVDYKTGNPNLNLDDVLYGLNMQLPIYLLLLKQLPFENIKIIGFYLQKILPSIPECDHIHTEEELKEKNLMLQGYSIDEESTLKIFDPSYENSKLISGMKVSSKGFYAYSKVLSEDNFNELEKIVRQKLNEAVSTIKQQRFDINPKRIGKKLVGCDYCKYQSICYRKEENIMNLKEMKLSDILGGEKNAYVDQKTK